MATVPSFQHSVLYTAPLPLCSGLNLLLASLYCPSYFPFCGVAGFDVDVDVDVDVEEPGLVTDAELGDAPELVEVVGVGD